MGTVSPSDTTTAITEAERRQLGSAARRAAERVTPPPVEAFDQSLSPSFNPNEVSTVHQGGGTQPSVPGMDGAQAGQPEGAGQASSGTTPEPPRPSAPSAPPTGVNDPSVQYLRVKQGDLVLSSRQNSSNAAVGELQGMLNALNSQVHFSATADLPKQGEAGFSSYGPATQSKVSEFASWYNKQPWVKPDERIPENAIWDAVKDQALARAQREAPQHKEEKDKAKGTKLDAGQPAEIVRDRMPDGLNADDRKKMSLYLRNDKERIDYLHSKGFLVGQDEKGKLVAWKRGESKCYKIDPEGMGDLIGDLADMAGPAIKCGAGIGGVFLGALAGGVGAPIGGAVATMATERWLLGRGHGQTVTNLETGQKTPLRKDFGSLADYGYAAVDGALAGVLGNLIPGARTFVIASVAKTPLVEGVRKWLDRRISPLQSPEQGQPEN